MSAFPVLRLCHVVGYFPFPSVLFLLGCGLSGSGPGQSLWLRKNRGVLRWAAVGRGPQ